MELLTYWDLARIFRVEVQTIRKWKTEGKFSILGYRRLGRWAKVALVSEEEVRKLFKKVLLPPGSHPALKKNRKK